MKKDDETSTRSAAMMDEGSQLVETYYTRGAYASEATLPEPIKKKARRGRKKGSSGGGRKRKPSHYKIVCISLYNRDIEKLEEHVGRLKRGGNTKANKSQVIRFAIDRVNVKKMPKVY